MSKRAHHKDERPGSSKASHDPLPPSPAKKLKPNTHVAECEDPDCTGCAVGEVVISIVDEATAAATAGLGADPSAADLYRIAREELNKYVSTTSKTPTASKGKSASSPTNDAPNPDQEDQQRSVVVRLFEMAIQQFEKELNVSVDALLNELSQSKTRTAVSKNKPSSSKKKVFRPNTSDASSSAIRSDVDVNTLYVFASCLKDFGSFFPLREYLDVSAKLFKDCLQKSSSASASVAPATTNGHKKKGKGKEKKTEDKGTEDDEAQDVSPWLVGLGLCKSKVEAAILVLKQGLGGDEGEDLLYEEGDEEEDEEEASGSEDDEDEDDEEQTQQDRAREQDVTTLLNEAAEACHQALENLSSNSSPHIQTGYECINVAGLWRDVGLRLKSYWLRRQKEENRRSRRTQGSSGQALTESLSSLPTLRRAMQTAIKCLEAVTTGLSNKSSSNASKSAAPSNDATLSKKEEMDALRIWGSCLYYLGKDVIVWTSVASTDDEDYDPSVEARGFIRNAVQKLERVCDGDSTRTHGVVAYSRDLELLGFACMLLSALEEDDEGVLAAYEKALEYLTCALEYNPENEKLRTHLEKAMGE
ncbi:hypothetical protein HK102_000204 [Quaeritorhiza haematococci]|nr:hypothetical protein HK102_000204 [Quaeritorhiza haematococci]